RFEEPDGIVEAVDCVQAGWDHAQQRRQLPLTFGQWQRPKVFAVNPKQIEGAEAVRMASGARGFKTRLAVRTDSDKLAVEDALADRPHCDLANDRPGEV